MTFFQALNIYTVHPHILSKHKLLFWTRLISINRLTALLKMS